MCEECGHATPDPEVHFQHLKDNHPYNPALTRCHDKRQFKFKYEKPETEVTDSLSGESIVMTSYSSDVDKMDDTDLSRNTQSTEPETSVPKNCETIDSSELTEIGQFSTYPQTTNEVSNLKIKEKDRERDIKQMMSTNLETKKRSFPETDIRSSPRKKQKQLDSPRKSGKKASPVKVRPLHFGERTGILSPRFDTENLVSSQQSTPIIKKQPLGSLTQNTIHLNGSDIRQPPKPLMSLGSLTQNTMHLNGSDVRQPSKPVISNQPVIARFPLGSTNQNTQWR